MIRSHIPDVKSMSHYLIDSIITRVEESIVPVALVDYSQLKAFYLIVLSSCFAFAVNHIIHVCIDSTNIPMDKRSSVTNHTMDLCWIPLIVPFCWDTITRLWYLGPEEHVFARPKSGPWILIIFLGKTVYRTIRLQFSEQLNNEKGHASILYHHVASITVMVLGLYTNLNYFWCALNCLSELTSIFLAILFLHKDMGWNEKSIVYQLNGFLLWLSFLILRIINFPCVIAYYTYELVYFKERTWTSVSNIGKISHLYNIFTTLLLFVLSSMWFQKISAGLFKSLNKHFSNKKDT